MSRYVCTHASGEAALSALLDRAGLYITTLAQRIDFLEGALRSVHDEAVREPLEWNLRERMGNIEVLVDEVLPDLHARTALARAIPKES